jgi:hypothetical protein
MPETMRAFVMQGIDRVAMSEKPVPDPGPDDAIVKTTPRSSAPPTPTPSTARSATATT